MFYEVFQVVCNREFAQVVAVQDVGGPPILNPSRPASFNDILGLLSQGSNIDLQDSSLFQVEGRIQKGSFIGWKSQRYFVLDSSFGQNLSLVKRLRALASASINATYCSSLPLSSRTDCWLYFCMTIQIVQISPGR